MIKKKMDHSLIQAIPQPVSTNMMTRNTQWFLQHCDFYKNADQIVQCFILGQATVVAYGSFSPHVTLALGSSYWRAELTDGQVLFTGVCKPTGSRSNPYRAELTGLYRILATLLVVFRTVGQGVNVEVGCDCKGAINSLLWKQRRIKISHKNTGLIRAINKILKLVPYKVIPRWIQSHSDDNLSWTD